MRRFISILVLSAVLFGILGCSGKKGIISEDDFSKIYADMLLADEWLDQNEDFAAQVDTSWFYKPIFEKYGYTFEEYLASVAYYLSIPKTYSAILKKTSDELRKQTKVLEDELHNTRDLYCGEEDCKYIKVALDTLGRYSASPRALEFTWIPDQKADSVLVAEPAAEPVAGIKPRELKKLDIKPGRPRFDVERKATMDLKPISR